MLRFLFFLLIFNLISINVFAEKLGSITGFKIPRYVSLKSNEVNLRVGSSKNYPIILTYTNKNFPIEIIEESENWRKIKDLDENIGWIHKNLLKGDRYAIINNNKSKVKIYFQPNFNQIAEIGNQNIVKVNSCLSDWCNIQKDNVKGWVKKIHLWGVYKNELVDIPFYQIAINQLWKINKFLFN